MKSIKTPSWKKIVPVAILLLFGIQALSGTLVSVSPYLRFPTDNSFPHALNVSASSSAPTEGMGIPTTANGVLALAGRSNAWLTSYGCGATGTFVTTKTYFANTVSESDSVYGTNSFSIQDNVIAQASIFLQLVVIVQGDTLTYGVELWGGNGWHQGEYLYQNSQTLTFYPGTAGYSIVQELTYGSSYVPTGMKVQIFNGGTQLFSATGSLPSNITETTLAYQTVIVGAGGGSFATFNQNNGQINYESSNNLFAVESLTSSAGSFLLSQCMSSLGYLSQNSVGSSPNSNVLYDTNIRSQGTSNISQQWTSPIPSSQVNQPGGAGTHNYFGIMTTDGSVATMESKYTSWANYGGSSSLGGTLSISQNQGLVAEESGYARDSGIVNSTALSFASGGVLSFQISSPTSGADYKGNVVLSSQYVTSGVENSSAYLDFCICNDLPEILFDSSSNILWAAPQAYGFTAWTVELGPFGVGLTVYLNTGTGFQQIYSNPSMNLGFDLGYIYAYTQATSQSNDVSQSTFAYISAWTPDNPVAEGTIDMNVWYLVRHYEQITAGTYQGDAVILDTNAPPLWANVTGGTMYAGMANGQFGQVLSGVVSTSEDSQIIGYLFCDPGNCPNGALSNAENLDALTGNEIAYVVVNETSSQITPSVTYSTTVYPCNSGCNGDTYTMYLAGTEIASSGNGMQSYSITVQDGYPGMRYVVRHITEVTGLLFDELGYSSIGATLTNFVNGVITACGCSSPYEEFYSPMFPTIVNNSALPSNWYDTYNAFPQSGFYNNLPYATSFEIPNSGGYSQWSDPYVSRLSINTNSYNVDQNFWLNGVQDLAKGGYSPSTNGLISEYVLNTEGMAGKTEMINELSTMGWDGIGTSTSVCSQAFYQFTIFKFNSGAPYCYSETAYPTYDTAVFLSAASTIGSYLGNSTMMSQANQAASVLENLLWSGAGNIAGISGSETLWQDVGGEYSAYGVSNQLGSVTQGEAITGGFQYTSNQGGFFSDVSSELQVFGVDGVQPAESPGFEPTATEATGLTAAALLNFVKSMPGQSSGGAGVKFVSAVAPTLDTIASCSVPSYCSYSMAQTGIVQFKTTDGSFNATIEEPYQINQPILSSTATADFALNGTVTSNYTLFLSVTLKDPLTGTNVIFQSNDIPAGYYNDTYYSVSLETGKSIRPGDYLLQMGIYGSGDFMTNNGYIQPIGLSLQPNTISWNFAQDAFSSVYATVNIGNGQGYCSPTGYLNDGLNILAKSSSGSVAEDCGIRSENTVSYIGSELTLSAVTNATYSTESFYSAVAISPDIADSASSSSSLTTGLQGLLPNYLILQSGIGDAKIITRANGGTSNTITLSDTDNIVFWHVYISPGLQILVVYQSASVSPTTVIVPLKDFNTNLTSVYAYVYQETFQTSYSTSWFATFNLEGSPVEALATNTGQMNQFGSWTSQSNDQTQSQTQSGTGPQTWLPVFQEAGSYLYSSQNTSDFDRMETIAFWIDPYSIGGGAGSSGSTMVVDNGGCCNSWWFEYYNNGHFDFKYTFSNSITYSVQTSGLLNSTLQPYYVVGVWNSSGNYLALYINGVLKGVSTTSGVPDSTTNRELLIGTGNCVQGDACYNGNFYGVISGLTMSSGIIANENQVDQMMQAGFTGSQLGGGYWYPLVYPNGNNNFGLGDMFGVGPSLSGALMGETPVQSGFPYYSSPSLWNPWASTNQLGYIVPLYIYPGTAWTNLIVAKGSAPGVPITVIVNPSSGPGTSPDPNYVNYIQQLQNARITVLGYVYTSHGSVAASTVEFQMSEYKNWYNIDGIDLDSMSTLATKAAYYRNITTWGHENGFNPILGVPGSPTKSALVGTVDIMIPYVSSTLPTAATVQTDTLSVGGSRAQWGIIVTSQSSPPSQSYLQSIDQYISWIYVTDSSGFSVAPSYQTTFLEELVIPSVSAQVGLLFPMYIYPGTAWTNLISLKENYPSVPMIVVINPSNGPGSSKDSNYVTYTKDLENAGITVLGYIYTHYADGTITQSSVESQANTYKSWYSVNGLFLDQMDNKAGGETYYSNITSWAHSNGFTPVVGNPGTTTISGYVGTVDIMIPYESNGLPSAATVQSDTTALGGSAASWGIIAYNTASSPTVSYIDSVSPYIGWIYVTDAKLPNPYNVTASYEGTEIEILSAASGTSSVAPFTVSISQQYGVHGPFDSQGATPSNQGPSIQVNETACGTTCSYQQQPIAGVNLFPVDLSLYNPANPLILSFDYRATSTYTSGYDVSNFFIQLSNANHLILFSQIYYPTSTGNSEWQTFTLNIQPYVAGQKDIKIFVGVQNNWEQYYGINDSFDNFQVYVPNQPAFQALSLFRAIPNPQGSSTYTLTAQGGVEVPNYTPPSGKSSVSVWFEPYDVTINGNPRIVANDHTDTTKNGFQIFYNANGTSVTMDLGSGTHVATITLTTSLHDFTWYQADMTYNDTYLCGYLYGQNQGLISSSCSDVGSGYSMTTGQYPVSIGFNPQYQGDFFPGAVSDLRISSIALTASQTAQLFADGPTSNLLAPNSLWLPFSGSMSDALGSGIVAVPYINGYWWMNYVSFISEE